MVTDSTVDSGSSSSHLPKQIGRSHGHGLLADGLSQHRARQVHGSHMAGEDRRQRKMTLGGLSASLLGRLTESMVRSRAEAILKNSSNLYCRLDLGVC